MNFLTNCMFSDIYKVVSTFFTKIIRNNYKIYDLIIIIIVRILNSVR
jgi:hypothetical protein